MSVTNLALIQLVRSHLLEDIRLSGQCVDVSCSGGYIELIGSVDTLEQKELAVVLVKGIVGVRHVEDRITVRGSIEIRAA